MNWIKRYRLLIVIYAGAMVVGVAEVARLDSEEQEFLDFIQWKFNAIMPDALYADGLVPPAGGSFGLLRQLLPKEYSFHDGWMVIGYQLVDDGS